MKRAAVTVTAALLGLALAGIHAPDARADSSAGECVRLREAQGANGMTLSVDNDCPRSLTCALSWTLQCEAESGKVMKRTSAGVRLLLAPSTSQTATASAAGCGDSWRIDDVSWSCAPIK